MIDGLRAYGIEGDKIPLGFKDRIRELCGKYSKLPYVVVESNQETVVPHELHTSSKKMKLELRFAKRSWERFNSNQERIRKMQEKRAHVAIFAA